MSAQRQQYSDGHSDLATGRQAGRARRQMERARHYERKFARGLRHVRLNGAQGAGYSEVQWCLARAMQLGAAADHFYCSAAKALVWIGRPVSAGHSLRCGRWAGYGDLRRELIDEGVMTMANIAKLTRSHSGDRIGRKRGRGEGSAPGSLPNNTTVIVRFSRKPDPQARGALAVAGFWWDGGLTAFVGQASQRARYAAGMCAVRHGAQVEVVSREAS